MKMYFPHNMGNFDCYVSLPECNEMKWIEMVVWKKKIILVMYFINNSLELPWLTRRSSCLWPVMKFNLDIFISICHQILYSSHFGRMKKPFWFQVLLLLDPYFWQPVPGARVRFGPFCSWEVCKPSPIYSKNSPWNYQFALEKMPMFIPYFASAIIMYSGVYSQGFLLFNFSK